MASIIGTIQSTFTTFPYLRKVWKDNAQEERLLGVSITGIMDCPLLVASDSVLLNKLKQKAIDVNKEWAEKLGINPSVSVSCVKPSGTVSQLVDSSSGIHTRHNEYYIRSVRGDNKDPITQFMKDQGIPNEPEVNKPNDITVFYFPIKSPEGAITRKDLSAIDQLVYWKHFQDHWCEHKPSVTISVKEEEWPSVGGWVYEHFDSISGVSFLPYSDHTYRQAPYQECTKEQYEELKNSMPGEIDWDKLSEYEKEDNTVGMQSYACSGDSCEIVDLT